MLFYLRVILKSVSRAKTRVLLTLLTVGFAFMIYGVADIVGYAFKGGRDLSLTKRLVSSHKVSMVNTLPIKYKEQMEMVAGVKDVTYASWFGGYYLEEKNQFPHFAVLTEQYMRIFDELILDPTQYASWLATPDGVVVGRNLADRFGWTVGQLITVNSTIWRTKADSDLWAFVITGIYEGLEVDTDTGLFLMHHSYFDEVRSYGNYTAGWFSIKVDANSPEEELKIAKAIDLLFANSEGETKTASEQAFLESMANQYGDMGLVFEGVMTAVLFTLLLICFTTMAQVARERKKEMAILRALGFHRWSISGWLIIESVLIMMVGALLGLVCSIGIVEVLKGEFENFASSFNWNTFNFIYGLGIAAIMGVLAAIFPAIEANRAPIAQTLKRG